MKLWMYKCDFCPTYFLTIADKVAHMEKEHGTKVAHPPAGVVRHQLSKSRRVRRDR